MGSLAACRRLRRAWHYQDTLLGRATCSLRAQEPPARRSVSDARTTSHGRLPEDGLTLSDFLRGPMDLNATPATASGLPSPTSAPRSPSRSVFIETYGCQMNVNDTEVVRAILRDAGYTETRDELGADVVLINTCAIRESAEERVWGRLASLRGRVSGKGSRGDSPRRGTTDASTAAPSVGADGHFNQRGVGATGGRGRGPVVGLLGCMAERLRERVLDREKLVDVVVGPDAYRDLPRLLDAVSAPPGERPRAAVNVQLSLDETYADVVPVRAGSSVDAFVSITRGCNNMCAFCVVPFTRGRERSRPVQSILDEVRALSDQGYKEVTLLGQNVNSYAYVPEGRATLTSADGRAEAGPSGRGIGEENDPFAVYAAGFKSVYKPRRAGAVPFAELFHRVSEVDPEMRVRFTSPHPKDFSDDVLDVIRERPNVTSWIHMPAQSGSTTVLERMRRGYTREAYDALVERIQGRIPFASISTDMIVGFCGETEEEHQASLNLLARVGYSQAFMFAYSKRDKTYAARHYEDDVPQDVKARRLREMMAVQREALERRGAAEIGRRHLVLIKGPSKRDASRLTGRACGNQRVVLDGSVAQAEYRGWAGGAGPIVDLSPGDYVAVEVVSHGSSTLFGAAVGRTSLREFVRMHGAGVAERADGGRESANRVVHGA